MLELRVMMDLARLWGEQGRRSEALALLTPLYGRFTGGLDTGDLGDAKTLLGELALDGDWSWWKSSILLPAFRYGGPPVELLSRGERP